MHIVSIVVISYSKVSVLVTIAVTTPSNSEVQRDAQMLSDHSNRGIDVLFHGMIYGTP